LTIDKGQLIKDNSRDKMKNCHPERSPAKQDVVKDLFMTEEMV